MPEHLEQTLEFVRQNGACTAHDVCRGLNQGPHVTAYINRLVKLESMGLVERTTGAKPHRWSAVVEKETA
jgi:hypothetical protein